LAGGSRRRRTAATAARHPWSSRRWPAAGGSWRRRRAATVASHLRGQPSTPRVKIPGLGVRAPGGRGPGDGFPRWGRMQWKTADHTFNPDLDRNTVKHVFFACIKFSWISRVGQNRESKYPRKSSLPIKGLVNTSRTLGKRQIKMQRNCYIPKSWN